MQYRGREENSLLRCYCGKEINIYCNKTNAKIPLHLYHILFNLLQINDFHCIKSLMLHNMYILGDFGIADFLQLSSLLLLGEIVRFQDNQ